MRRSVALVSAAITTFSVVVLVSIVYAYQGLAASPSSAGLSAGPSVKTVQVANAGGAQSAPASSQPALAQAPNVSVQAAASIAAQYVHRTDLFSAELAAYNGSPAFKITFSSGDVVYVSMAGEVLGVAPAPTYSTTTALGQGSGGGHFSSHSSSAGEHEDGAEHEGGD